MTLKTRLPQIAAELPARVDPAVKEGAEIVAQYARFRVPVDHGDLRDAIHVERDRLGSYYAVGGNDEAWYGGLVEWGTTRQPPRPFLVPALEDARDEIVQTVTAGLRGL